MTGGPVRVCPFAHALPCAAGRRVKRVDSWRRHKARQRGPPGRGSTFDSAGGGSAGRYDGPPHVTRCQRPRLQSGSHRHVAAPQRSNRLGCCQVGRRWPAAEQRRRMRVHPPHAGARAHEHDAAVLVAVAVAVAAVVAAAAAIDAAFSLPGDATPRKGAKQQHLCGHRCVTHRHSWQEESHTRTHARKHARKHAHTHTHTRSGHAGEVASSSTRCSACCVGEQLRRVDGKDRRGMRGGEPGLGLRVQVLARQGWAWGRTHPLPLALRGRVVRR
eukprot:227402-Chlamydomonas_euryale.AAC.1